jgi:SAM-dependent methyltransferase
MSNDTHTQGLTDLERAVARFEQRAFEQEPVTAAHYDQEYFADDWREGDNRYDVETRRRIEATGPQLIKDVFEPTKVLDMGCGPGFLMLFLTELGVDVEGVDFSPASQTLAPEGVRDRIRVGPVTEPQVAERAYDLVICREVMEHLTVLQVRQTVAQVCRASSRFVYCTTRFHPDPEDLLDFTTQFDVDPSHITLLTKPFLRCLFVLEGFRRREDLEDRMDWAGKGRVLVYERDAPESEPPGGSASEETTTEPLARVEASLARLSGEVQRLTGRLDALATELSTTPEQHGRKLSARELAAVKSSKARAKRAARLKSDHGTTPPNND